MAQLKMLALALVMACWWTCNKPSPDPVIMPYGVAMPQCANWNDSFGHEDLLNCENISVYVQSQFSDRQVCDSLAIPSPCEP